MKALEVVRYDALQLAERPVAAVPEIAAKLLADAWLERGPSGDDREWLRRLRFAGDATLTCRSGCDSWPGIARRPLTPIQLGRGLPAEIVRALDRDAPATIAVPSGRQVKLEYAEDGSVSASVKLQELFGLAETPRVGPRREPVLLALLAPNGRPVQMTRDLRSFWDRTYPEVRKELRGRYPKHPWPDDPWNAAPRLARVVGRTGGRVPVVAAGFSTRFMNRHQVLGIVGACALGIALSSQPRFDAATSSQLAGSILVDGQAYHYVSELTDTFGSRLTGSSAYQRAADWAVNQFHAAGVSQVATEPFTIARAAGSAAPRAGGSSPRSNSRCTSSRWDGCRRRRRAAWRPRSRPSLTLRREDRRTVVAEGAHCPRGCVRRRRRGRASAAA